MLVSVSHIIETNIFDKNYVLTKGFERILLNVNQFEFEEIHLIVC